MMRRHADRNRSSGIGEIRSIRSNSTPPGTVEADASHILALQRKAGNRATQSLVSGLASGGPLQRRVLFASHLYEDGTLEPEIRTSDNFDTNHLVEGEVTTAIANSRFSARVPQTSKNTVVSEAALKREVEKNDLDLIRRVGTNVVTRYQFASPAEAMQSSGAESSIFSSELGLMSRQTVPNVIEIHHLHEAEVAIHESDFPKLGEQAKPRPGSKLSI